MTENKSNLIWSIIFILFSIGVIVLALTINFKP